MCFRPYPRSLNTPAMTVGLMALLSVLQAPAGHAQQDPVRATINAAEAHAPISPYLYGQFLEHIGGIVNRGLWAEMLDDRKFYYPVVATAPEPQQFGPRALRRWTSIGPAQAVAMDTEHPFVGEHSPRVALNGKERRGLQQAGLVVEQGESYVGRVVLAADAEARAAVSLVWGGGAQERETIPIDLLAADYVTYPLAFTARADAEDARLEITAIGTGALRVGAVSLMPADNVGGFRPEVVAALKSLRSGVYRFPGGNFVSAHEWRNAIGPPDLRPPVLDPVWNAVQPNDVGTDEFLTLCRLLGVEPYITVNAGFGDAWSAAQLVEYTNGSVRTEMGRLRAANGHPRPYHVKFWGIGNEMWGSWQMGTMALDQYVIKHNLFAEAMLDADSTITLMGSGAMQDHMTESRQAQRLGGQIVPEPLGPADWTGGLLQHSLAYMDMISEHFYSYGNRRFDVTKGEPVDLDPDEPLVDWMRRPANRIKSKAESYDHYLELIPGLRDKRIPIALSEWAYAGGGRNSYKVVPAYAWVFQEMFRHSGLYRMANFTFATSLVSATPTDATLNPAGLVFKLYRDHFGTLPVTVAGNAPPPAPKYPPGGEEPRVNAGSPTFPLDVAAAWTDDGTALTVAVINPTESVQPLALAFEGADLAGTGTRWRMAPDRLDASIVVGQEPEVVVEEDAVTGAPSSLTLPPFSVTIYRLDVR